MLSHNLNNLQPQVVKILSFTGPGLLLHVGIYRANNNYSKLNFIWFTCEPMLKVWLLLQEVKIFLTIKLYSTLFYIPNIWA